MVKLVCPAEIIFLVVKLSRAQTFEYFEEFTNYSRKPIRLSYWLTRRHYYHRVLNTYYHRLLPLCYTYE